MTAADRAFLISAYHALGDAVGVESLRGEDTTALVQALEAEGVLLPEQPE